MAKNDTLRADPVRVVIADDHVLFREGLRAVLEASGEAEVVGEAGDGDQALAEVNTHRPDVILLDVSMPGRGGLEVLAELKRVPAPPAVIILTAYPEERYAVRSLRSGADGYVTKDRAAEELMKAIRKVYDGGKYVSPSLAEKLASRLEEDTDRPHERLSAREYQSMLMIAAGRTVSQIADELGLSVKTVSTYRSRILQKLHLDNNAQIMHYALQEALIQLPAGD